MKQKTHHDESNNISSSMQIHVHKKYEFRIEKERENSNICISHDEYYDPCKFAFDALSGFSRHLS